MYSPARWGRVVQQPLRKGREEERRRGEVIGEESRGDVFFF